ncbi:hypothetical protein BDR05DRAFT_947941 [Suillus weaverae]|nr:hypothetical protein BDR05DRAFT_947941 [Suillus weaverae]
MSRQHVPLTEFEALPEFTKLSDRWIANSHCCSQNASLIAGSSTDGVILCVSGHGSNLWATNLGQIVCDISLDLIGNFTSRLQAHPRTVSLIFFTVSSLAAWRADLSDSKATNILSVTSDSFPLLIEKFGIVATICQRAAEMFLKKVKEFASDTRTEHGDRKVRRLSRASNV